MSQTMGSNLVISVLGKDRPGIVNELSECILDAGGNIADSRMSILGGDFAVILMVSGNWNTVAKIESQLAQLAETLDMTITSRRTEQRPVRRDLLPYGVDVVALDHPGIVHHLASFFSARDINIQGMDTSTYCAAHTGTPMFNVHMTVEIPARLHIATLREDFMEFCDQLNLDGVMEPIKA
jgi:glycine cleavage system transcriptional repressor